MSDKSVRQTFEAALGALVEQVKADRSVLAAILCGSLSHDAVWKKSDIDLVLVTVDDKKVEASDIALYSAGVNVHAILFPRAEFRKAVEGSMHNSFMHSFLAKGRLLYTHDPTIGDLCDRLQGIGSRDAAVQLLRAATGALPSIDKAHKWFVTRRDLDYSALWILHAATALARIEVISAGQLLDREALPQAMTLNPAFFTTIYSDLLNERKTPARVEAALLAVDVYVASRARALFALVVDYLREAGEVRSCTEIQDYFRKTFDVTGVTTACEYLADQGIIGKASTSVHLTKRSNIEVQELAFYFMSESKDGV
jgi:predicted nucleotidyltransferase